MTRPTQDRPVTIRPAVPEHLPEIHRMQIALAMQRGGALLTPRGLERIARGHAARLLVAHLDDSPQRHPVGYALLVVTPNLIAGADWGFVEQLYVQEPERRRGIGRALIAAAKAEAAKAGCRGVTIRTRPETDAPALLYRAERPFDLAAVPGAVAG